MIKLADYETLHSGDLIELLRAEGAELTGKEDQEALRAKAKALLKPKSKPKK